VDSRGTDCRSHFASNEAARSPEPRGRCSSLHARAWAPDPSRTRAGKHQWRLCVPLSPARAQPASKTRGSPQPCSMRRDTWCTPRELTHHRAEWGSAELWFCLAVRRTRLQYSQRARPLWRPSRVPCAPPSSAAPRVEPSRDPRARGVPQRSLGLGVSLARSRRMASESLTNEPGVGTARRNSS